MNNSTAFTRPVIFGEVLFDCFPDGSRVLGGAPFNVAWLCQAFGLHPLFISRLGKDSLGSEVMTAMLDWGMDVSGLQHDPVHATGIVDVSFNHGEPAYNIIENSAWDFINDHPLPELDSHSVLYHGSLALRNTVSADCLSKLKQQCPESIFIDINLRPPWWDVSTIQKIIQNCRWIKLNSGELDLISPGQGDFESKARNLLSAIQAELIVITQGEAGATAVTRDDTVSVLPNKTSSVIDTVGAGDAFSSVLLLGMHKAWPVQTTLKRGQEFASAVVEQRGAITQEMSFYQTFIMNWELQP